MQQKDIFPPIFFSVCELKIFFLGKNMLVLKFNSNILTKKCIFIFLSQCRNIVSKNAVITLRPSSDVWRGPYSDQFFFLILKIWCKKHKNLELRITLSDLMESRLPKSRMSANQKIFCFWIELRLKGITNKRIRRKLNQK